VLRADTNEPLRQARIDLVRADWAPPARRGDPRNGPGSRQPVASSPPMLTTTSDEQGRFSFSSVAPGRYTVRAARNQFVRMDYGQRGRNELGTLIVVERGGQIDNIVLRLFRAPTLAGRITDASGQPLAAATVAAYKIDYSASGRTLALTKATLSDDRGEYRLFWLPPGDYYLAAGYGAQVAKPLMEGVELTPNLTEQDQAATVIYYPGTTNVGDAVAIRLSAGLDSFRDIQFREVANYRIRGYVVEASTNRPVSGAEVFLLPGNGHSGGQEPEPILTDSSGAFTIPATAAGSYVLYATADPIPQSLGGNRIVLGRRLFSELRRLNLSMDVDTLILPLTPGVRLNGRVRFEGLLADGAGGVDSFRTLNELDGAPITLVRRDGGTGDAPGGTLSGSAFTILDTPPGHYEVSVPVPPGYYIKSIRYDGRDALSAGLTIRGIDPQTNTLEIVLGPGASIDGRILERAEPVGGAQIVIVPDPQWNPGRSPDRFKIAATDMTGGFTIRSIAPGRYLAFAFEEIEARFYFDPEFLNRFGPRGVAVQLEENSFARPDLHLIPAAETEAWNR
jgi:protocatechuate 3,4-dioxygenase beta subunit